MIISMNEVYNTASSLKEVANQLKTIKDNSFDELVKREDILSLTPNYNFTEELYLNSVNSGNLNFSDNGFAQMCNKLGIPTKYMLKCIDKLPHLAVDNMSSWLGEYNGDMFLRMCNPTETIQSEFPIIRGVLSGKYSVYDSSTVLDTLSNTVNLEDYKLKGSLVTPERMCLRFQTDQKLDIPNEDLFLGIQVTTSDVGRSPLSIICFIYKQVCTNGLIVKKAQNVLFNQKHIGITSEAFANSFKDNLSLLPLIKGEYEKMIKQAIKVELSDESLEKCINNLRANVSGITDEVAEEIKQVTIVTYAPNLFGYINALTQVAQKMNFDKRLELETYAGSLMR